MAKERKIIRLDDFLRRSADAPPSLISDAELGMLLRKHGRGGNLVSGVLDKLIVEVPDDPALAGLSADALLARLDGDIEIVRRRLAR